MDYLILKAIHIISVVCWFAGLFYIVRLYIYDVEAEEQEGKDILQKQFRIMQRRLWYGITVPAAWFTLFSGAYLVIMSHAYKLPWFHVKATALLLLFWYHFRCGSIRKLLIQGQYQGSSKKLRGFNEIATLLLVILVFAAVTKSWIQTLYGFAGFCVIGLFLFFFFRKRLQGKTKT